MEGKNTLNWIVIFRPGLGKTMHGQDGADLEIKVPVGTVVRQIPLEDHEKTDWTPPECSEDLYSSNPKLVKLLHYFKFRKGFVVWL